TFLSWPRLTTCAMSLKGLVNPRFGRRRYIGIWPPSKPGLVCPPVRALCPLLPLPEVFPKPEPAPLPTRLRAAAEAGAGIRFCNVSVAAIQSSRGERTEKREAAEGVTPSPFSVHCSPFTSTRCLTLYSIPRTDAVFFRRTTC